MEKPVTQPGTARRVRRRGGPGNGNGREAVAPASAPLASERERKRQFLAGLRALQSGDFTARLPDTVDGLDGQIGATFNELAHFFSMLRQDVLGLRRNVGLEGRTHSRLMRGVARGGWADFIAGVNDLLDDVTAHTADVGRVLSAVANGDLAQTIDVEGTDSSLHGDFARHARLVNRMVAQLAAFSSEVTRVAQEVGVDGKLGAQASIPLVSGVWKELTDSVNLMASNLTNQVREIAQVTTAVAKGDLTKTVNIEAKGEILQLKNTINTMVEQLGSFASEVTRVAREVGTEGILGGQAYVRGVSGVWRELTQNVNSMGNNLTTQVRNIAEVATAIAEGDLSRKITVGARGEVLELKETINTMVDQLNGFAAEVTRVAREVGTDGVLGGQAEVRGVSGVWRGLTDNVNVMARNLTEQVRGIARVVTAVANGDLDQKLTLSAKGEIATLVETINAMIVTLSTFADQVISVARDVGVEGRLGGQADVPGAAGVWRDLTNNVNELAGNLTRQVRAIGDVATAVTKGDLTQSINVDARGEVALLKDNVNQMIRTLASTTMVNEEQDWLKTNLARFTRMLQGQRDLVTVTDNVLTELAGLVNAQHGSFFIAARESGEVMLKLYASYAHAAASPSPEILSMGQGLVGQAARDKKRILVNEVPAGYVHINSSLGQGAPLNLVVVPIAFEGEIKGVIELASFHVFGDIQIAFLEQLVESLGIVIATIEATMRTDQLLRQSQSMAEELQSKQQELQNTNEELEEKARQLGAQKTEVERKNRDVEIAKQELEEKAEQLALTSRYKSQFLANMSHELRTPLNSLMILSRQLEQNREGNLTAKQVEFASTIRQSGTDLLALINEILDLAKIESGTMAVEVSPVALVDIREFVERSFRQVAEEKKLAFMVDIDPTLSQVMHTDDMRLRQVLRNLLSNALKFTEKGKVTLRIFREEQPPWPSDHRALSGSGPVIGFSVEDTGIGIPVEKQKIVFEAFQQADGGTSRKYGGTGLGLAISREIAGLLGGELRLASEPGVGSTVTLFLPITYVPRGRVAQASSQHERSSARTRPDPEPPASAAHRSPFAAVDDRENLDADVPLLLVAAEDEALAMRLLAAARENGFRGVLAGSGQEGLELADSLKPDGIMLDTRLPDMEGWVLLDQLKHGPRTRHIPVQLMAAATEVARGPAHGALHCLAKPLEKAALDEALAALHAFLERPERRALVVAPEETDRQNLVELVANGKVGAVGVANGQAAEALQAERFDCVVMDLRKHAPVLGELIDVSKRSGGLKGIPIVAYRGDELWPQEVADLHELASMGVVRQVASPPHLLAEAAMLLHQREEDLSPAKRNMLRRLAESDPHLAGKLVLLVDDDARNLFAITTILEQHGMRVLYAENGQQALDQLAAHTDVDLVLMDIMMPEMDGYEATRRIRQVQQYSGLPIIALTARAMKGDREKCIQSGASDYITKPIDAGRLVSMLRVWLA